MEESERNHIRSNLKELILHTKCTATLLAGLVSQGVLAVADIDKLNVVSKTEFERALELYEILVTKDCAYKVITEALLEERQTGAYKILLQHDIVGLGKLPWNTSYKNKPLFAKPLSAILRFLGPSSKNILLISTPDKQLSLKRIEDTGQSYLHLYNLKSGSILGQLGQLDSTSALVCSSDDIDDLLQQYAGIADKKIIFLTDKGKREIGRVTKNMKPKPDVVTEEFNWTDLHAHAQEMIQQQTILFQNRLIQLKTLPRGIAPLNQLTGKILIHLINGTNPEIVNTGIPTIPSYHIPRVISINLNISLQVLQCVSTEVMVIKGIRLSQLAKLAQAKNIDRSSNQIHCLSAKIIQLEHDSDFEKICNLSDHPVHLLSHEEGRFKWIKSKGSLKLIQKHMHPDQPEIDEAAFVNYCMKSDNPVCITDTPGMGKSTLLSRLAHRLLNENPESLVRFVVLRELTFKLGKQPVTIESVCREIGKLSSAYEVGISVVAHTLKSEHIKCHVLFDGYDEISKDQMEIANNVIECMKQLRNTKLYVTTRPHMRFGLEQLLGTLGIHMKPLQVDDQINFLIGFWEQEGVKKGGPLREFAKSCLNNLCTSATSANSDITGIPLQCYMLGRVYLHQALQYTNAEEAETAMPPSLRTTSPSIFEMYETLVEIGFQKLDNLSTNSSWKELFKSILSSKRSIKDTVRYAHMYYAIELLFPDRKSEFKKYVVQCTSSKALLYVPGVLELDVERNYPRFVHRTFAEYFVALFLFQLFCAKHKSHHRASANSLLMSSLATSKSTHRFNVGLFVWEPESYSTDLHLFENPVLCYFLNNLIQSRPVDKMLRKTIEKLPLTPQFFYNTLIAAVRSDYAGIASIFSNHVTVSGNVQWPDIFLISAQFSSSIELFKQLSELLKKNCSKVVCEVDYPVIKSLHNSNFALTPLHVAVNRGEFNLTTFLLSVGGFDQLLAEKHIKTNYLLHCCVAKSPRESSAVIKEKVEIIRLLCSLGPSDTCDYLLREKAHNDATPLLQGGANLQLIKCLIEVGADVNARDARGENVLYTLFDSTMLKFDCVSPSEYHDLIKLLEKFNFKHFNPPTELSSRTPIGIALVHAAVQTETIDFFLEKGLDISQTDDYGKSLFIKAVQGGGTRKLLEHLVERGANPMVQSYNGMSALQYAVSSNNVEAVEYLVETTELIRDVDNNGNNAMHTAMEGIDIMGIHTEDVLPEILMILLSADVDLLAINHYGCTPILHGLKHGRLVSLDVIQCINEKLACGITVFANVCLKSLISRNELLGKWDGDELYAELLEYFLEMGAVVVGSSSENPWEIECVAKNMESILSNTECTEELLKLLHMNPMTELGQHKKSKDIYDNLKYVPGSYERMILALTKCRQIQPFGMLRNFLEQDEKQSVCFITPPPDLMKFLGDPNADVLVMYTVDTSTSCKRIRDTFNIQPKTLKQMQVSYDYSSVQFVVCSSEQELENICNNWLSSKKLVCIIQGDINTCDWSTTGKLSICKMFDYYILNDLTVSMQRVPWNQAVPLETILPFSENPNIASHQNTLRYPQQFYTVKIWTRSDQICGNILLDTEEDFVWNCEKTYRNVNRVEWRNNGLQLIQKPVHIRGMQEFLRAGEPVSLQTVFSDDPCIKVVVALNSHVLRHFFLQLNCICGFRSLYFVKFEKICECLGAANSLTEQEEQRVLAQLGLTVTESNATAAMDLLVLSKCLKWKKSQFKSLNKFGELIKRQYKSALIWVFTTNENIDEIESGLGLVGYELTDFNREEILQTVIRFSQKYFENSDKLKDLANMYLEAYENHVLNSLPVFSNIFKSKMACYQGVYLYLPPENPLFYGFLLAKMIIKHQDGDSIKIVSITELCQVVASVQTMDLLRAVAKSHSPEWQRILKDATVSEVIDMSGISGKEELDELGMQVVKIDIASFMLAQLLVDETKKHFLIQARVSQFVLTVLLSIEQNSRNTYSFRHPSLCYFVNSLLGNKKHDDYFLGILHSVKLDKINIVGLIGACVVGSYLNILKHVDLLLPNTEILFDEDMLALAVRLADVHTVAFACEQYNKVPRRKRIIDVKSNNNTSLLKLAVSRSDYLVTEYLLHSYFFDNMDVQKCLLHECVSDSIFDSRIVLMNKIKIIELLVSRNHSTLDEVDPSRNTPLLSWGIHLEILKLLISLGANIIAKEMYNSNTVLHIAGQYLPEGQYSKLVNFLVHNNQEALLNHKNGSGLTMLHFAARCRSPEEYHDIVQSLHDQSLHSPFEQRTDNQCNVIIYAVSLELKEETLKLLLNRVNINDLDNDGDHALFEAISKGRDDNFMDMMIRHGADFTIKNKAGWNVLHWAAKFRNVSALQFFLLQNRIDVNEMDCNGMTPLNYALRRNDDEDEYEDSEDSENDELEDDTMQRVSSKVSADKEKVAKLLLDAGAVQYLQGQ